MVAGVELRWRLEDADDGSDDFGFLAVVCPGDDAGKRARGLRVNGVLVEGVAEGDGEEERVDTA